MAKKILTIVLTVIVFISVAVLGVSSVCRVSEITIKSDFVSPAAQAEEQEMLERMEDAYDKESMFLVDREKCEEIVSDYPHFRITKFKKSFPNRIVVYLAEDPEVYAIPTIENNGKYYILGADGTVLGIRDSKKNRLDGEDNVFIRGLTLSGEKGGILSGDARYENVYAVCSALSESLGDIRQNVLSVYVYDEQPEICIRMREGINIYLGNIADRPKEKAKLAIDRYLEMESSKRLTGYIAVSTNREGALILADGTDDVFNRE